MDRAPRHQIPQRERDIGPTGRRDGHWPDPAVDRHAEGLLEKPGGPTGSLVDRGVEDGQIEPGRQIGAPERPPEVVAIKHLDRRAIEHQDIAPIDDAVARHVDADGPQEP